MISKRTRRSVPRVLDRGGRRRCCTFLGGNSGFAPRTAHWTAEKLRLLVMRYGGSPLPAHRRRLMRLAVLLHRRWLGLWAIHKSFRASFHTLRPFGTREAL
jgi:hypothetical protein